MKKSIARLLVEYKTLGKQIEDAIKSAIFIGVARKNDGMAQVMGRPESVAELEELIKSKYQRITDLMGRHSKIKAAITLSNATTNVTICGNTMTVADAINLKQTIEKIEKPLVEAMRRQHKDSASTFDMLSAKLSTEVNKLIDDANGKDRKADQEGLKAAIEIRKQMGSPILIDPIKLRDLIDKKQKESEDYLAEVDFALSESNARTELEV